MGESLVTALGFILKNLSMSLNYMTNKCNTKVQSLTSCSLKFCKFSFTQR